MSSSLPILVAIPEEWLTPVRQHLEAQGYLIISATSQEKARELVKQEKELLGVIILSDWAMSKESPDSLIKLLQGKTPTITIITETTRHESGYRHMDEVFFPPAHEYVSAPFSLEELDGRMRITGMKQK